MDKHSLDRFMAEHPEAHLKEAVEHLLYEQIVELHMTPGSKLNVNQIAATLGISRTPVAEAVAHLTEIGYVVNHPGINGSYVIDLTMRDMMDLYRVRSALESEAAALCAFTVSGAQLKRLSDLAEAFTDAVERRDIRGMKDTDMPFHRMIIESCGNPYIISSYEHLLPRLTMYQYSMTEFIARADHEQNLQLPSVKYNHLSVVNAIRLHMPEYARSAMAEHVDSSLGFITLSGVGENPFETLRSLKN